MFANINLTLTHGTTFRVTVPLRVSDPAADVTVIVYVPTGVDGKIVTTAEADLLVSACDTAPMFAVAGVGTDAGAV